MINKIILKNVQAHKISKYQFSSGINFIIGESDKGKTSLFRAIRWIIKNRPLGDSIIRKGKKKAKAKIITDRGKITKIKDRQRNDYDINGNLYKALKGNVPEEVKNVLDLDEINIQDQLKSFFLILDTPGKIAEYINRLTDLENVGKIVSLLNRRKRQAERKEKENIEHISELKEQLKSFDYLDNYKKLLKNYEKYKEKLDELENNIDKLNVCIQNIKHFEKEKKEIKIPKEMGKIINDLKISVEKYNKLYNDVDKLGKVITHIKKLELKKEETERIKNNLETTLKSLRKALTFCPTCERKLTKEAKINLLEKINN